MYTVFCVLPLQITLLPHTTGSNDWVWSDGSNTDYGFDENGDATSVYPWYPVCVSIPMFLVLHQSERACGTR